jgi:hypothetical protein
MSIQINPGTIGFHPSDRLLEELQILERVARTIIVGSKTIEAVQYNALLIKGMGLTSQKFKASNTDLLMLLPPDYPRLPPIGCYLNYPWKTVGEGDHHFTRQSYYGAPFLSDEGWYWYCVGLGGGFNYEHWLNAWRPATPADRGHNLSTLFITARHAINTDE